MSAAPRATRVLRHLLYLCAALLFVLALLAGPRLVAAFHFRGFPSSEALAEMRRTRVLFAGAGLLAWLAGWRLGRTEGGAASVRLGLLALCGLVPLLVAERLTRPFVEGLTELHVADEALGWRHRPGIEDSYWGEPVRINSHGMRGPERGPGKDLGARRILFLGDSVVFGLALADEDQTIPARLERELDSQGSTRIEVLNAAVCGWSTWQQQRFLAAQGELWQPDLVLLGFVLNDVTERFELEAFGGATQGAQLAYAAGSGWRSWLSASGLYLAFRELHLRHTLRAAAEQRPATRPNAYHVVLASDSDAVQAAWKQVLPELEAIREWCQARAIPLALVIFPFAIQVDDPSLDAPQWILRGFAERRGLPCLDLLPALARAVRAGERREDLFLDGLHMSAEGAALASREIAAFLQSAALIR